VEIRYGCTPECGRHCFGTSFSCGVIKFPDLDLPAEIERDPLRHILLLPVVGHWWEYRPVEDSVIVVSKYWVKTFTGLPAILIDFVIVFFYYL
jgi:hypothetical protein